MEYDPDPLDEILPTEGFDPEPLDDESSLKAFAGFWWDAVAPTLYQGRKLQGVPQLALCRVCERLFLFPDARQSCCRGCRLKEDRHRNPKRDRNHSHRVARDAHNITFVGIDGEGINIFDDAGVIIDHKYVLLSATGSPPLKKDGERLMTQDVLHYLYYTVFKNNPDACFVGYAIKYDFSQWVRDLPQSRAHGLFTKEGIAKRKRNTAPHLSPFPVYWRDASAHPDWRAGDDAEHDCEWEFDFLGDKRLKLRPYVGHRKHEKGARVAPNNNQWMYINDAFSFFQCSFVTAINPDTRLKVSLEREWLIMWNSSTQLPELPVYLSSKDDYDLIVAGKKRRADAPFDDDMVRYN